MEEETGRACTGQTARGPRAPPSLAVHPHEPPSCHLLGHLPGLRRDQVLPDWCPEDQAEEEPRCDHPTLPRDTLRGVPPRTRVPLGHGVTHYISNLFTNSCLDVPGSGEGSVLTLHSEHSGSGVTEMTRVPGLGGTCQHSEHLGSGVTGHDVCAWFGGDVLTLHSECSGSAVTGMTFLNAAM